MPRFNSTGIPTQDYLLGRGCLSIAELDANDVPKGYIAMGNALEFKMTPKTEKKDHYSSCSAVKTLDASVITQVECAVSIKVDEASLNNIQKFLLGSASGSSTNAAVAGFASYQMVKDGTLTLGATYPVQDSFGVRAMDINPANLTITTSETVPVALVLGTDYTVDAVNGSIFILSSSTVVATAIGTGDGLLVALAADAGAGELSTLTALDQGAKNYALYFKGINPADSNREYVTRVFKAQLAPSGDFGLIGEEFSEMVFEGNMLKSNDPQAMAHGGFFSWESAN